MIALLEQLGAGQFPFFWEQANPETGLVRDRVNVRQPDKSELASIAATGFGLTALCIGEKRGFAFHNEQEGVSAAFSIHCTFFGGNCRTTADFSITGPISIPDRGFGIPKYLRSIRQFCCAEFFSAVNILCIRKIHELASAIYNRVDWNWLSEDTPVLPHGWTPESGFLQYRWDDYSEMMMMYLLGLGSDDHPLPDKAWDSWKRSTFEYSGIRYIGSFAPLFIHQYSQAWFDFRGKRDHYADYFKNSIIATDVHRRFCLDLALQFPDYSDDLWGITASDSSKGYVIWGGPPPTGPIDGTVVPCATGGSIPFQPDATMRVLRNMKDRFGNKAWSDYGFVDAFNPLTGWFDTDVVGIDVGISMVMAENARTSFVWDTFMKNPEAKRAMQRAGFQNY